MTLQERIKVYQDQLSEWTGKVNEAMVNTHRLGGAIAAIEDQIKEEVEMAANKVGAAAAEAIEGELVD